MALIGLHYSSSFKKGLLDGEIKGAIIMGEWKIPVGENLFVYSSEGNAEESKQDEKIGGVKIISSRSIKVKDLSDKEAKNCNYENADKLKEAIKYWHKCDDSETVAFIEFDFTKI